MFTKTDIEKYFLAEKAESKIFLALGIIAILLALFFFAGMKTNFYKGAAVSLVAVGLLFCVVGYTVYQRSDGDRKRNVYAYDLNPGELRNKEIPRMEKVMKSFVQYRYTEIVLALLGIALFYYFKENEHQYFWKGFGLALCIMALASLSADYFAEKRGHTYLNGLKNHVKNLPG